MELPDNPSEDTRRLNPDLYPPEGKTKKNKTPRGRSKLEIRAARLLDVSGLSGYREEVYFHPTRRWRFDFAWAPERVALEIEGGVWLKGNKKSRHTTGRGFTDDREKYNEAMLLGWLA